jgi:hypothetical protein
MAKVAATSVTAQPCVNLSRMGIFIQDLGRAVSLFFAVPMKLSYSTTRTSHP